MTICRLLNAIAIMASFVVILSPIRAIFMSWAKLDRTTRKGSVMFIVFGLSLVTLSTMLSILVPDIVTVLNFVASIFGIGLCWIMPLLFIWKLPYARAVSDVPIVDDEEVFRRYSEISKSITAFQMVQRNSMHIANVFDLENPEQIPTQEEALKQFKQERRSSTYSFRKSDAEVQPKKNTEQ
jgi:hypothetical protein